MLNGTIQGYVIKLKQSIQNPLILNMLLVGGITLFVKLISFYKETLIASFFGLSEVLDTYFIAILIPTFIQNVFIGALKNLFIPNYITEIKTSNNKGSFQSLIGIGIVSLVLLLSILAIIFSLFFLEDIYSGHTLSYYAQIRTQLYIVLPCIFFWGFSGFISGLLEIENKYLVSTIAQLFLPITTILCLLFFKDFFGNKILAVSILLG
uniref:lipid II flippase MurJ n=1 Tax=Maribacter sp. TaxID=1897614 RepID=UPI0025C38573